MAAAIGNTRSREFRLVQRCHAGALCLENVSCFYLAFDFVVACFLYYCYLRLNVAVFKTQCYKGAGDPEQMVVCMCWKIVVCMFGRDLAPVGKTPSTD